MCEENDVGHIVRNPFNQNFWKFRSKTQWISSVQAEKLKKSGPPFFKVDHVSQSDRSNAPPILLIARTITDRIGLHLVLLPLLITMVYL